MHGVDLSYTELDGVTESGLSIPTGRFRLRLAIEPDRMAAQAEFDLDTANLSSVGTPAINSMYTVVYVRGLAVALDYAIWIETL